MKTDYKFLDDTGCMVEWLSQAGRWLIACYKSGIG